MKKRIDLRKPLFAFSVSLGLMGSSFTQLGCGKSVAIQPQSEAALPAGSSPSTPSAPPSGPSGPSGTGGAPSSPAPSPAGPTLPAPPSSPTGTGTGTSGIPPVTVPGVPITTPTQEQRSRQCLVSDSIDRNERRYFQEWIVEDASLRSYSLSLDSGAGEALDPDSLWVQIDGEDTGIVYASENNKIELLSVPSTFAVGSVIKIAGFFN